MGRVLLKRLSLSDQPGTELPLGRVASSRRSGDSFGHVAARGGRRGRMSVVGFADCVVFEDGGSSSSGGGGEAMRDATCVGLVVRDLRRWE